MDDMYKIKSLKDITPPKRQSRVKVFFKRVFVSNFWLKFAAIVTAFVLWLLFVIVK